MPLAINQGFGCLEFVEIGGYSPKVRLSFDLDSLTPGDAPGLRNHVQWVYSMKKAF